MTGRTIAMLVWPIALNGCAGPERAPATPDSEPTTATIRDEGAARRGAAAEPLPPFEHEADTEYANGIASMMTFAPVMGAKLVTADFQLGYLAGLGEARSYQFYMNGMIGTNGCLKGFDAVMGYYAPPTEADIAKVKTICENKRPEAGPQGAQFSQGRMKEAQWAGEHFDDPREIKVLVTIYTVGYNMGFAHQWESVDQEANVEAVFKQECQLVVDHMKPPLPPDQLATASKACSTEAHLSREQFGPQLRCLLANKDMNGDLSGVANKFGCPHGA